MKRQTLGLSRASMLAASTFGAAAAFAQGAATTAPAQEVEEIIVTGVRAAQQASIDVKRESSMIVDAISAEDIGKLPDVTISDSLQRIPGVQIRRDAGEGAQVAIRGLPQVTTLLNGEQYLGANSTTTVQPNYGDIPSQLFSGVDVFKTSTAGLINSGMTGTVNLKTRRPFDMPGGLTTSLALETSYGGGAEEFDPQANALVAWNNDRFGALLSVAFSNVNLANYYSGVNGDTGWTGRVPEGPAADAGWVGWVDNDGDVNNDGDDDDLFIAYQGHTAFNRFTERERLGVNGSVQFQFTDALQLTADAFYTNQDQFVRTAGMAATNKWQNWGWWTPLESRDTGAVFDGRNFHSTQVYDLNTLRLKSFSQVNRTDSESTNFNLELRFDNGGKFTGGFRAIVAEAENNLVNSYADIDLANGTQWLGAVDGNGDGTGGFPYYPTGYQNPYPNGYIGNQQIIADYSGDHVRFSNIPSIVSNLDAYSIGALSSENNFDREADLKVFRLDGSYAVNDVFSIDAGVRFSESEASQLAYDYLAPFYAGEGASDPNGCLVKWKATDVVLNSNIDGACTAGDGTDFFTALGRLPLSSFGNDVMLVTDFGNASGVPPIFTLNPEAMDNPLAFHNSLFPGNVKVSNPGQSFVVGMDQTTAFLQGNIGGGDLPYSGNFGLRYIKTELDITQNSVGAPQPYGAANLDGGDLVTKREFNDWLPSLNLAFDLRDDLKFRIGYTKTMTPLNLEQWGGALSPSYAISNEEGGRFIVISANATGNPQLDPWRSENYDASLEWYATDETLLSVAVFHIDVESFIAAGQVIMPLPDQDGVIRREVTVNTSVQGDGGTLDGIELGVKHAFSNLPGFWSNFGIDANYTYSPSDSGNEDLNGDTVPFLDNSEVQTNLVLWYEADRFQARIAHNHRSKRVAALDQVWGTPGLTLYQSPTDYIDASVAYDVTEQISVYLQGLNLTDEYENYYLQWEDQRAFQQQYERRFILGVRGRF